MAVLIDTSVLVDIERRSTALEREVGEAQRAISVITASELLHGLHRASDAHVRARREAFVEHILAALDPIPITTKVARTHARLWAGLERAGTRVGGHDMWIAATALSHGMELATANAVEFERVPGLTVIPI